MALADMLSAMRGIILDGLPLPQSENDREVLLRKYFPKLSTEEANDLAQIPLEKLAIYTGTIFRGETGLLQRLFPMSFALLRESATADANGEFSPFYFTKRLHKAYPWKSYQTVGLAQSFISFIEAEISRLPNLPNALADISNFEFLTLQIARAKEAPPASNIRLADLQQLTVSELLSCACLVPLDTKFAQYSFDTLKARRYFLLHQSLPTSEIDPRHVSLIGARDTENTVRWVEVPPELFSFLQSAQSADSECVEDFAEAALSSCQAEGDEERFRYFFELLSQLVQSGAIVLSKE